MPRPCTICIHPDRRAIERALHAGRTLRTTAARWSVSKTALLGYRDTHVPTAPGIPHSPQAPQPPTVVPQEPPTPTLAPPRGRAAGASAAPSILAGL